MSNIANTQEAVLSFGDYKRMVTELFNTVQKMSNIANTQEAVLSFEDYIRVATEIFRKFRDEKNIKIPRVTFDELSGEKNLPLEEARLQAAPSYEDSNRMRIAELEERIRQLSKAERDLIEQLDAKHEELLNLEDIIKSQEVENEEFRENNFLLEARLSEMSETVTDLSNKLIFKSIQFSEMEDQCSKAIATAVQQDEELKVQNTELETSVQLLLETEVDLRNDVEIKNLMLEETEMNCATVNAINDDLRKRVKQHLKVVLDLEKRLEEQRIRSLEVEDVEPEANSFNGESRRSSASLDQLTKVQNWLENHEWDE